jgi:hypothetical protein
VETLLIEGGKPKLRRLETGVEFSGKGVIRNLHVRVRSRNQLDLFVDVSMVTTSVGTAR